MLRISRSHRLLLAGVLAAAGLLVADVVPGSASAPAVEPTGQGAGLGSVIPDSYIVVLNDNASVRRSGVDARARDLSSGHGGRVGHVWDSALHGFSVTMTEGAARKLAAEPDVRYVEQNRRWRVADAQPNPPSWGLDRVDQRGLAADSSYSYDTSAGQGVHAYIVDTGIRITHAEFGGRASYGYDFIDDDAVADDCYGHGTHVAGTVGGTTVGVAKKVQLVAVRVLDCSGRADTSSVADGINWVVSHAIKPAVINLSIETLCADAQGNAADCPVGESESIVAAENGANAAGIPVVAAAGNHNIDACGNPLGGAVGALTVGATDATDAKAAFSNFGRCVDIFAPGTSILSAGIASDTATTIRSGTSMSAPHVTGAVALLMATPQFATATPDQIKAQLVNTATTGVIGGLDPASPNRLLYTSPPPAPGGSSVALTRNADGRLELFGVNKDGYMFVRAQTLANSGGWGPWTQSSTKGWFSVGAEPNADGRIELVVLTATNQVWHRQQTAVNANTWTTLYQLTGQDLTSVTMARNGNGRLAQFGTDQQGRVWYRTQLGPGTTTWTPWALVPPLSGGMLRSVTAATASDGRIVLVATDRTGLVWSSSQVVANADTWSPRTQIWTRAGNLMNEAALIRNSSATLELMGTDGAGGVWHTSQVNGNWQDWSQVSSFKTLRHITADLNADGRVAVIGVDNLGTIWQSTETSAGSDAYSAWTQIDGQLR